MTKLVYSKALVVGEYAFPDIALEKGEALAICGQSGSGKSIFLRCLAGLVEEYTGFYSHSNESKAFIFQEEGLLDGYSVYENLRLSLLFSTPKSEAEIDDALQRFGVLDAKHVLGGNLNRVAKKMVQYARADLLEPTILYIEAPYEDILVAQRRMIRTWLANFISVHGGVLLFSTVYSGGWEYLPAQIIQLEGGNKTAGTIISV